MSTPPYLDIHTHGRLPIEGSVSVECLSIDELKLEKSAKKFTTAGIHPWWIQDHSKAEIEGLKSRIEKMFLEKLLWGVGETGLDRAVPGPLAEQRSLFLWHLALAEKGSLPLVIHNVRAGSDFLEILKSRRPTTPWIFHDFRGNEALMRDLLRLHSQCFFSFGMSLDNSREIRAFLPKVPLENLFLETDDQKHLDIHDIYLRASECLSLELEFLKSRIWNNFQKISRQLH